MLYFDKTYQGLINIDDPQYLIASDFDETYLPTEITDNQKQSLRALEEYLTQQCQRKKLLFSWITGSSLPSLFKKASRSGVKIYPKYIAASLATEIYVLNEDGRYGADENWQKYLQKSSFSPARVKDMVKKLSLCNVELIEQHKTNQSQYKVSFYYKSQTQALDIVNIQQLKDIAASFSVGVNISVCNPMSGDPQGHYDVDFTPIESGKVNAVKYLLKATGVKQAKTIAVGDSGNDLDMLKYVDNGFLVGNSTQEAKNAFATIESGEYSEGILAGLKRILAC